MCGRMVFVVAKTFGKINGRRKIGMAKMGDKSGGAVGITGCLVEWVHIYKKSHWREWAYEWASTTVQPGGGGNRFVAVYYISDARKGKWRVLSTKSECPSSCGTERF